ncbi:MAG: hypothetical protein Q9161_007859 [Pseudevernia consocians]
MTMNVYLLLLAFFTSAINTTPSLLSPDVYPNTTQPLYSFGIAYRCASPAQHDPGRRMPSALDCLNVLTYVLATTPNHDRPTQWSRGAGSGQTMLPYRRSSGSCQLLVRLTPAEPAVVIETATFDQVIGAAMRITEVCLLNSRPDVEHWGGAALAGLGSYLDVIIWGSPQSGGSEAGLGNETVALDESGAWITGDSQR